MYLQCRLHCRPLDQTSERLWSCGVVRSSIQHTEIPAVDPCLVAASTEVHSNGQSPCIAAAFLSQSPTELASYCPHCFRPTQLCSGSFLQLAQHTDFDMHRLCRLRRLVVNINAVCLVVIYCHTACIHLLPGTRLPLCGCLILEIVWLMFISLPCICTL